VKRQVSTTSLNRERLWKDGSCHRQLLQLGVLGLGFFQDRDVGVGVFPEGEEILIRRVSASRVVLRGKGAGEAELGQGPSDDSRTVDISTLIKP
jgi:hypothetical protein